MVSKNKYKHSKKRFWYDFATFCGQTTLKIDKDSGEKSSYTTESFAVLYFRRMKRLGDFGQKQMNSFCCASWQTKFGGSRRIVRLLPVLN